MKHVSTSDYVLILYEGFVLQNVVEQSRTRAGLSVSNLNCLSPVHVLLSNCNACFLFSGHYTTLLPLTGGCVKHSSYRHWVGWREGRCVRH